ncbi:MAG: DUF3577 domain-containing protein [Methylococcaceae bacterium]
MTNSTQNNQVSDSNEYFDLHTTGVGYINRVREVDVKKGENFMACTIGALRGSKSAVEYTYFDCRVSGSEAAKVIKSLEEASKANKQILAGFKVGDQYSETFVYKSGNKKGETGICTKAHLLYLSWVKIDGDTFYTAPSKNDSAQAEPAPEVNKEPVTMAGSAVGEFS